MVDDERDAREMIALFLAFRGDAVHVAATGFEAIDMAVRFRPAIILMDLMMPRMDGWEVRRSIILIRWQDGSNRSTRRAAVCRNAACSRR